MTTRFACPPDHKHAQVTTCYVIHKCRCPGCCSGISERARRRNRLHAYGRFDSGLVDIGPVREHVIALQATGLGWKRIAELAGVGNTATSQIIYGRKGSNVDPRKGEPLKRIKRETADKILAVQPSLHALRGGALVPARPYARRLQALVAIGWSQSKLATRLGLTTNNFRLLRHYEQAQARRRRNDIHIAASTARAIAALYDELSNQTPPLNTHYDRIAYNRTIRYAADRGWPLPMDWTAYDDNFDRPHAPKRSTTARTAA